MTDITITPGDIATAVRLSEQIPEFRDPHGAAVYEQRLGAVPHLVLIAWYGAAAVGFKVGYAKGDEIFYSWMGGVLPSHRQRGVARQLAEAQESWARGRGYTHVLFKTRNSHKAMLIFALGRGFDIIGITEKESAADNRILLSKAL